MTNDREYAGRAPRHEGIRTVSHRTAVTALCAAAFAQLVTTAATGDGAMLMAGTGVAAAIGGNVLTDVVRRTVDKLRAAHPDESLPPLLTIQRELQAQFDEVLRRGDDQSQRMAEQMDAAVDEMGLVGEAIVEAVRTGNAALQEIMLAALDDLKGEATGRDRILRDMLQGLEHLKRQQHDLALDRRKDRKRDREMTARLSMIQERLRLTDSGRGPSPNGEAPLADQAPYRGLLPFGTDESFIFHGRGRLTAELIDRIHECLSDTGVLIVTGPSGAGKSSLLSAGLLHAIGSGMLAVPGSPDWPRVVLTPTTAPLEELASHLAFAAGTDAASVHAALVDDPMNARLFARQAIAAAAPDTAFDGSSISFGRMLLIVDQFEELFTLAEASGAVETAQSAFIAALNAIASARCGDGRPANLVIVSVRSDFLDRCAAIEELAPALQDDMFVVGPMSELELRQAITGPAAAANLSIENYLTSDIIAELRDAQRGGAVPVGALPLLSQAMLRIWEHREASGLTHRSYERAGGVSRAVEASAEEAYSQLNESMQGVARVVFGRLSVITADGTASRRPADIAELCQAMTTIAPTETSNAVAAVLDAFTARRLIVRSGHTVEIAHDVLLIAWPRLVAWLAEDRDDRTLHQQLAATVTQWQASNRDVSFLLSGTRLAGIENACRDWSRDPLRFPQLSDTELVFLTRSNRRARKVAQLRKLVTLSLTLLLVVATTTAILALRAEDRANDATADAVVRQLIAQSANLLPSNPTMARLLSAAAWQIEPGPQTRAAMRATLGEPDDGLMEGQQGLLRAVAFSPDSTMLATAGRDGQTQLWDPRSLRPIDAVRVKGAVDDVEFSPVGGLLATADEEGVHLSKATEPNHGDLLAVPGGAFAVAFNPNGSLIAVAGEQDTTVWDVARRTRMSVRLPGEAHSLAFSPDGRYIAVAKQSGVDLWDWRAGQATGVGAGTDLVTDLQFDPTSRTLAMSGDDGALRLVDTRTHKVTTIPGKTDRMFAVAFNADGTILATGGYDQIVRLWDVATKQVLVELRHDAPVLGLAFARANNLLAAVGDNGMVRLWDLKEKIPFATLPGIATAVAFGSNGALAVASDDTTELIATDTNNRTVSRTGRLPVGVVFSGGLAFNGNGTGLAVGGPTALQHWDVQSKVRTSDVAGFKASRVVLSPDGSTAAIVEENGTLELWDMASERKYQSLGDAKDARWITFDQQGRTLAVIDEPMDPTVGHRIQIWDVRSGARMSTFDRPGHLPVEGLALDGDTLALATEGQRVEFWNIRTGEPIGELVSPGGADFNKALAFNGDGSLLAVSTGFDLTVELWDVPTRTRVTRLSVTAYPRALKFNDNGTSLAVISQGIGPADGSAAVTLWDVRSFTDPYPAVCRRVGRGITHEEWRQYAGSLRFRNVCS